LLGDACMHCVVLRCHIFFRAHPVLCQLPMLSQLPCCYCGKSGTKTCDICKVTRFCSNSCHMLTDMLTKRHTCEELQKSQLQKQKPNQLPFLWKVILRLIADYSCYNVALHLQDLWGCDLKFPSRAYWRDSLPTPFRACRQYKNRHKTQRIDCSPVILVQSTHVTLTRFVYRRLGPTPDRMRLVFTVHDEPFFHFLCQLQSCHDISPPPKKWRHKEVMLNRKSQTISLSRKLDSELLDIKDSQEIQAMQHVGLEAEVVRGKTKCTLQLDIQAAIHDGLVMLWIVREAASGVILFDSESDRERQFLVDTKYRDERYWLITEVREKPAKGK